MSEAIGNYIPTTDFTTAGSGSARWCFAKAWGRDEVFLKEFLSPVYPDEDSGLSEANRQRKIEICLKFESRQRRLMDTLKLADAGNLIFADDFFRHKTKYYAASPRVPASDISIHDIHDLPRKVTLSISCSLIHSLVQLENQRIVHADLKGDNLMLKKTKGDYYALKLIDFDASYFCDDTPKPGEDIQGDQVYLAPETLLSILGQNVYLSSKVDVFALGILLHQFFTGSLPGFDMGEYHYLHEAVLDDACVTVEPYIPAPYHDLIADMLAKTPEQRPDFASIFAAVNPKAIKSEPSEPPDPPKSSEPPKKEKNMYLHPAYKA